MNNKSNQSPRNSPPKSDERVSNQQRWNDGSIERLATKWAAKRDALLKETGVLTENLQQRKAEMEQKLESVKRSIPKRSMGFTPESAQKRLSLCESTSLKSPGRSEQFRKEVSKRNSLDSDVMLTTESEDSDEDKFSELPSPPPPPPPPPQVKNSRKSSPEAGSSDSDDSLPPYPVMEKNNSDSEIPLPPPPVSIESCVSVPEKTSTTNVSAIKSSSSSKLQLFSQGRVGHGIFSVWFRYEKSDQLKQELLCS